jgi:hypothetical protein
MDIDIFHNTVLYLNTGIPHYMRVHEMLFNINPIN